MLRLPRPAVLIALTLLFILPFHFVLLSIATKTGIPGDLLRLLPLWKEIFLCFMLIFLFPILIKRFVLLKVCLLDILVISLFIVTLVYSYNAFLYGLRSAVFFFALPYFLGRLLQLSNEDLKIFLKTLKFIAFITSFSAIIEKFFLPVEFWRYIGLSDYLTFSGFFSYSPPGPYGLPWTFFNSIGIKRSGGIFANPLDLSQSLAILISLPVVSLLFSKKTVYTDLLLLILVYVAIIFSMSRTNIVVATLTIFVLVLRYRPKLLMPLFLLLGIAFVGVIITSENIYLFILKTITFNEHSSNFHLNAWLEGWNAFLDRPFGYGIGTSGVIGYKAQSAAIGGESDYIVKLVQTGIIGVTLYVILLVTSISILWDKLLISYYLYQEHVLFFVVTFSALLSLTLAGITSEVSLFPRILCWFFLGCSSTLYLYSKPYKKFESGKIIL